MNRASGLGLATAKLIQSVGGAVAILDRNEDAWKDIASSFSQEAARFYRTDVTNTENIADALSSVAAWSHENARPLGGLVAAAGIGNAERVCRALTAVTALALT